MFRLHPLKEMFYEDLAENTKSETDEALDFLEVEQRDLETKTIRQRTMPLLETITNYSYLKGHFGGSEWEQFFSE